jgi:hypothetical protein
MVYSQFGQFTLTVKEAAAQDHHLATCKVDQHLFRRRIRLFFQYRIGSSLGIQKMRAQKPKMEMLVAHQCEKTIRSDGKKK